MKKFSHWELSKADKGGEVGGGVGGVDVSCTTNVRDTECVWSGGDREENEWKGGGI